MNQTLTPHSLRTGRCVLPRPGYLLRGAKGSRSEAGRVNWEAEYIKGEQIPRNRSSQLLKNICLCTAPPPRRRK